MKGAPGSLADWAELYAGRMGWAVFPLRPRTKEPATEHGCNDASKEPEAVRRMWDAAGDSCNIGLATGPRSGVFVFDVDAKAPKPAREGGDPGMTGPDAIAELEQRHGPLPPTRTVRTSNGGWHAYFAWPEGRTLRNRARIKVDGRRTGLDCRAEGGYVVLPPSIHPSGEQYAWGPVREVAQAPAWLLDLLDPPQPQRVVPPVPVLSGDVSRFGSAALTSACQRIATAQKDHRHDTIFREAAAIGELVGGGVLSRGEAEAALCQAGESIGKDAREVARTVRQALDRGEQNPRRPEPREQRQAPRRQADPWQEQEAQPRGDVEPPVEEEGYLDALTVDDHTEEGEEFEPVIGEPEPYRLTDVGNGARLVDRFGGLVRWCGSLPGEGTLVYDGQTWASDDRRKIDGLAKAVARDLVEEAKVKRATADRLREAAQAFPEKTPERAEADLQAKQAAAVALKATRWAEASEMGPRLREMMTIARNEVAITVKELDADPWKLNTWGGVVDLKTGDILPHRREDYHTRITGAHARMPPETPRVWLAFLRRIMGDDDEMVSFLQRVLGYCLTASTREQCLFVLHGAGSNGKSTFLDTVRHVLGDYVVHTRAETFVVKEGSGGVPNDVAALRGARVVTASEIKQGARLDESLIKEMTGDAAMTARFMRAEFFTFEPTWKVLWALNHRPVIRGTDMGIWRRMRLIPFEVSIPDEEKDRDLGNKLKVERDGILAWMIAGCEMWQQIGLAPPERVLLATKEYREDMDILKDFLEERCDVGEGCGVSNTELYSAFTSWAEANGEREKSQRWFSQALHDRGFRQDPSRSLGRRWKGLALKRAPVSQDYQQRSAWS